MPMSTVGSSDALASRVESASNSVGAFDLSVTVEARFYKNYKKWLRMVTNDSCEENDVMEWRRDQTGRFRR